MSDFIRATVVGVDFKNLEHPPLSEVIHADVVLIDRSQLSVAPAVYYLKDEDMTTHGSIFRGSGLTPITDSAFTMLGSIESINKEKKTIQIRNSRAPEQSGSHTTVTYKHLIVASDLNHALLKPSAHDEFSAGLIALLDAIKLKKNIPEDFGSLVNKLSSVTKKKRLFNPGFETLDGLGGKSIEEIVHEYIPQHPIREVTTNLASLYKRLYEVHVGR